MEVIGYKTAHWQDSRVLITSLDKVAHQKRSDVSQCFSGHNARWELRVVSAAADECWFCLSNPKVTKHLIASIGAETYLTLPKGQLLDTSDPESLVPGGGHVLIIPVSTYVNSA